MSSMSNLFAAVTIGALVATAGCDSGGSANASNGSSEDKKTDEAPEQSRAARNVNARIKEVRGKLAKGDNAKYVCVGSLATHKALATSSDAAEKKAYDELAHVCFVEQPQAEISKIRKKIEAGEELKTTETVDLITILKGKDFPTEGKPAEVAADAKKLLEVEVPLHELKQHLQTAKKEKEAGERVSMGCIKAKRVVKKGGAALQADESAKPVLSAYAEACPKT